MLLEEKQDSCNDLLLLGDVVAEGGAVHMHMQAAGLGLMTAIVQLPCIRLKNLDTVGCDARASFSSTDLNTGSFVSSSEASSSK